MTHSQQAQGNEDSPRKMRALLCISAVVSVAVLVYASLIPFDYTPLSWSDTRAQWRSIPWLDLQIFHRADWVANALVVLPSGLLLAAAVDWRRTRRWPLLVAAPLISSFLATVVIAIECAQVWFPTRTVSLNDVAAGIAGAILGPLLWILGGRHIEKGITSFLRLPGFEDRLIWLCRGYFVLVVLYTLLPFDFVMSRAEWQARLADGSIRWDPFAAVQGDVQATKGLVLGAVRMAPLGILAALTRGQRLTSYIFLFLLPIGFEIMQLPLYSKDVSASGVIGGWGGGLVGFGLGMNIERFKPIIMRPGLWGLTWFTTAALVVAILLARHEEVLQDPKLIAERFAFAWDLPLVKYYAGSEYNAYTNLAAKAALFAILGATALGWQKTSSQTARGVVFWLTLVTCLIASTAIEVAQVFLPPLVPDFSDALTYVAGFAIGYQVTRLLWGEAGA